jgi:hypothetical protein
MKILFIILRSAKSWRNKISFYSPPFYENIMYPGRNQAYDENSCIYRSSAAVYLWTVRQLQKFCAHNYCGFSKCAHLGMETYFILPG